jgi:hypothetical protein
MVIAAFFGFGLLLVAWMAAPDDRPSEPMAAPIDVPLPRAA